MTCSFSPASVAADGNSSVSTTLTVQTTAASLASVERPGRGPSGWLPRGGAMLALAVLLMPSMRRRVWLSGASLLLVDLCLGGISGCAGGGNSSGAGTQNPNATPLGSYAIHVNTSVGSQQGAAPVTVSLIVKG